MNINKNIKKYQVACFHVFLKTKQTAYKKTQIQKQIAYIITTTNTKDENQIQSKSKNPDFKTLVQKCYFLIFFSRVQPNIKSQEHESDSTENQLDWTEI